MPTKEKKLLLDPKTQLFKSQQVNAANHSTATRLSPSVIKDCAHFRTYPKPITNEVKHRVKYSDLVIFRIDTRSLGNPFGKSLGRVLLRQVNGVEAHPVAQSLIAQIEKDFQIQFLQAEYPIGCWIQHKQEASNYLVVGSIDFVLWNKQTRQFMVLELKTKEKNHINYWLKARVSSTLWANDLPQALIYARALRCQLHLPYEPKVMILLCCRNYAYPRIIQQYGPQDYADHFTWSLHEPLSSSDSITLPASAFKEDVQWEHVKRNTLVKDIIKDDLTLEELCTMFHRRLVTRE